MSDYRHTKSLNIAGFILKLYSNHNFELEDGYQEFVTADENTNIKIYCIAELGASMFENQKPVFEAENDSQKFYSIFKTESGLGFIIYNQQQINTIQQIALVDNDFSNWTLYSQPTENGFFPLSYPMGPIIMHYMTLKTDAVMMHASCAFDGEKGRIFTGFSGAGKSTMSGIWLKAGNQIINDDRIIVRCEDGEFFVYNTPMYYIDKSKRAPLNSIFIISHSPSNKITKLQGALAVSKTMAYCIQNNFERQFIHNRLDFLSKLVEKVGIYDLGFVPNPSVVDFILSNEKG